MVFMSGDDADQVTWILILVFFLGPDLVVSVQYNGGHCGCDDTTAGCKCGSLYPNVMTLALQSAKAKASYMPNCPTCSTKKVGAVHRHENTSGSNVGVCVGVWVWVLVGVWVWVWIWVQMSGSGSQCQGWGLLSG